MIAQRLDSDLGEAQGQHRLRSRRSPLEVRMDILTVVRDGAEGPTQIMYKANLSWTILTNHLKELVGNGILLEHNVKNRFAYALTEKGISILRSYRLVVEQVNVTHYGAMPAGH
jgi:predicted transcriptional regulator